MTADAFNEVLSDVFLLGTGISRQEAKTSDRYRELCDQNIHVPYVSSDDVAEMMLLGEYIADRAFETIPRSLQELAKIWRVAGHDGQVSILKRLKREFGEDTHEARYQDLHPPKTIIDVLPQQYGNWGESAIRPNCLGMAQILIGFARAAGAPHMLIDSVQGYDRFREHYLYSRFIKLLRLIEPYEYDRKIRGYINKISSYCLRLLAASVRNDDQDDAHHALAIRTDDEWWIVDPYYEICCVDLVSTKELDSLYVSKIMSRPHETVSKQSYDRGRLTNAETRLSALEKYLPLRHRFDEPRSSWSFKQSAIDFVADSVCASMWPSQMTDEELGRVINNAMNLVTLPERMYRQASKSGFIVTAEGALPKLSDRLDRARRSKKTRNVAFGRLSAELIKDCYGVIDAIDPAEDTPSPIREYLHPTMQLAVKTLNHVAFCRQMDTPELIKYGSSQWLIHDMMGLVNQSGNARLQQIIAKHVRRLAGHPEVVLSQLRPYIHTKRS